jgi:F-type H+-transporting ATPase subunit b
MKGLIVWIAEVVAFFIIVWLAYRYVVPLLRKAMGARQAFIEDQMNQSEVAKAELAEAEAEYQTALAEARSQAAQIRENARAEAQRTVEELRIQAQEESARIVARGEEQLANQRGVIVRELRAEIGSLAMELSERVVTQWLTDEERARASVDALLADLERRDVAGSQA